MKTGSNQFLGNVLTDRDCPTDFSRQESTEGNRGHANECIPYTHLYEQANPLPHTRYQDLDNTLRRAQGILHKNLKVNSVVHSFPAGRMKITSVGVDHIDSWRRQMPTQFNLSEAIRF